MRRLLPLLPLLCLLPLLAGCGARYELPSEKKTTRVGVPQDSSYAMLSTWTGLDGVQDVFLTQGPGTQLFVLFNRGGNGGPSAGARGELKLYSLTKPVAIADTNFFKPLTSLYNPVAVASAQGKIFVLDQGDTCLARFDITRGTCRADEDTTFITGHPHPAIILDYAAWWHVREYPISGGDTISTFTDTTFSHVEGIAAGEDGYVYVSGIAAVLDTLKTDPRIRTRKFVSRVYRYIRGPRYPGIEPPDVNMPASNWHRDSTWSVVDGSGSSSVNDPAGIYYSRYGGHSLYVADRGNGQVKGVSVFARDVGLVKADGSTTGANFLQPNHAVADLNGFFYLVDRGNSRVLRYDARSGEYIQRVDIEPNAQNEPLLDPISVAADDSTCYVADRGRGKVIRFKRRS